MKVKYVGDFAAVTLDGVGVVENGDTVEVTAVEGKQLVKQGWEDVSPSSSKKAK